MSPQQQQQFDLTIDSLIEFANKVSELRFYQKQYFKAKDQQLLFKCRQLEFEVDKLFKSLKELPGIKSDKPRTVTPCDQLTFAF
jgi:hypothetical protein